MEAIAHVAMEGSLHGHRAAFIDGTAFGLDEIYLTVGAYSEVAPWRSDYNGPAYARLKSAYDPAGRLSGLYEKCVRGR